MALFLFFFFFFFCFFAVEPGGYRTIRKHTASRIAQCSPRPATCTCCIPSYRHWIYIPNANSNLKFDWDSGLFCVQSPWAGGGGAGPRVSGSHCARFGVSGGAEARPHARGSRLDVHTELAIVCLRGSVLTYIQNWQLFVYVGAPLGSDLGGGPEPPATAWGPPRSDREVIQNPHSLYYLYCST